MARTGYKKKIETIIDNLQGRVKSLSEIEKKVCKIIGFDEISDGQKLRISTYYAEKWIKPLLLEKMITHKYKGYSKEDFFDFFKFSKKEINNNTMSNLLNSMSEDLNSDIIKKLEKTKKDTTGYFVQKFSYNPECAQALSHEREVKKGHCRSTWCGNMDACRKLQLELDKTY